MAMPALHDWTVEMVHALPDDGNRYEVLEGELLVSPAPSMLHQRALRELVLLLAPYAARVGLDLLFAPAAVTWGPRTELQPDALVMPLVEGKAVARFEDAGRLELAVEVLSPSTARTDRYRKRPEYQRRGVTEYWIVDVDARLVERWRPGEEVPEVLVETLAWQPRAEHEPLVIDLARLFAIARGD